MWTWAEQKETTAQRAVLKLGPTSPTMIFAIQRFNEPQTKNNIKLLAWPSFPVLIHPPRIYAKILGTALSKRWGHRARPGKVSQNFLTRLEPNFFWFKVKMELTHDPTRDPTVLNPNYFLKLFFFGKKK